MVNGRIQPEYLVACEHCAATFWCLNARARWCDACRGLVKRERDRAYWHERKWTVRPPRGRHVATPEERAAAKRNAKLRRRSLERDSDVATSDLAGMIAAADRCPLCAVQMTPTGANAMTEKTVDHIVPLNVGGKHTMANIRVVCRDCNLRRPRDGSDIVEQVSLFQISTAQRRQRRRRRR
jgi:5-methylcytosine-specific restriction endonuclease McrA